MADPITVAKVGYLAAKNWKPLLIIAIVFIVLILAMLTGFSSVYTVSDDAGGDYIPLYKDIAGKESVSWIDVYIYDFLRTEKMFDDINRNSVTNSTGKFFYWTTEYYTEKDSKGKLVTKSRQVKNFRTLPEVLDNAGYPQNVIDYSLTLRQLIPYQMGDSEGQINDIGEILFSVPAGTFVWPVQDLTEISSRFGWRIIFGEREFHKGIDLNLAGNLDFGKPVIAAKEGVVTIAGNSNNGYGYSVLINHSDGFSTRYAHLSEINVGLGRTVKQGQLIGKVGNTGRSYGPHLHFEIMKNGSCFDPLPYVINTKP